MPKCVIVDPVSDPIRVVSEGSNGSLPVKTTTPTSGKTVTRKD